MLIPLFIATVGTAMLRSEQDDQLELGLGPRGYRFRPLRGMTSVLSTDGILYDLDENGLAVPSSRVLRRWRLRVLLVPAGLDLLLDTETVEDLQFEGKILVLTHEESAAIAPYWQG